MKKLEINSFGPVTGGKVELGDITLLIGPQASGKSLLLQLFKYAEDLSYIKSTLLRYGYTWGNDYHKLIELYFGEGMSSLLSESTKIIIDGKEFLFDSVKNPKSQKLHEEKVFYIPAQRVLTLDNGWPRNFQSFETASPFVLKNFSEALRLLMEKEFDEQPEPDIFPAKNRLNKALRDSINSGIFSTGNIILEKQTKKRMVMKIGSHRIPFLSWSAGQKEFLSLLMSLYWLCPPAKTPMRGRVKYVVIEEPEMGLHPEAIKSLLLQSIELVSRGYKLLISTHSAVFLEFAWAFGFLREHKQGWDSFSKLFTDKKLTQMKDSLETMLLKKNIRSYYFRKADNDVFIEDLSALDVGSDIDYMADWGGLSSFSERASNVVSASVLSVNK